MFVMTLTKVYVLDITHYRLCIHSKVNLNNKRPRVNATIKSKWKKNPHLIYLCFVCMFSLHCRLVQVFLFQVLFIGFFIYEDSSLTYFFVINNCNGNINYFTYLIEVKDQKI